MQLSLEPLGLGPTEDCIYLRLIERGRADAARLSVDLQLDHDAVVAALDRLVRRGLIVPEGLHGHRYLALSPETTFPELIRQRRLELNRLQEEADQLRLYEDAMGAAPDDLVQRVRGASAVHDICTRIQREAQHEVLMIDAPPYFSHGLQLNPAEYAALDNGVAYRVVYHSQSLQTEIHREAMRDYVAAGEQARVFAQAWPKLLIIDGTIAVIPESTTAPDPERRLVVRSSALVDTLISHFECIWERATPIEATGQPRNCPTQDISERDRELLMMMASGMKDRAIARSMGVTERTISRRIQELMRRLDADTRFRAGMRAVQRGWIAG